MKKKLLAFLLVPLCALLFTGCTLFNGEEEEVVNEQNDFVVDEQVPVFEDDVFIDIDDVIDPEDLEEGEIEEEF
jgi:hypothetical protein